MSTLQGSALCSGTTRRGKPCFCWAVPGLDRCLHHVDDDQLDLAELIMGFRRCRRHFGEPDACRYYATSGTNPPRCRIHGCNTGSVQWKWARLHVAEARLRARHHLPPAPSPERISAALMDAEAVYGRYKPPRRKPVA
jgi:hypothetical protein